jgi:hypothetical protein
MRLVLALGGFLVAVMLCLSPTVVRADDSTWLVGHWEGHNKSKPGDTRLFTVDIAAVNADQSFVAQWIVENRKISGQGKIDSNAVTINFPNGNSVSLFRASDGTLAGSTANKDGSGATLVFAKNGSAPATASTAPRAGGGLGCQYRSGGARGGGMEMAKDGDQVVARSGIFRCVNGNLQRVN